MNRPITRFSLLFLAFCVMGGQWLMLQSVAWVNMVKDYSHNATLSQALAKTFDGSHPCPLCRFIQKEKTAQNSSKVVPVPPKNFFLHVSFSILLVFLLSQPAVFFLRAVLKNLLRPPFSPPPEALPQF